MEVEQAREFERFSCLDPVIVHDVERIVGLRHVQASERTPGSADGVEVAVPALVQPIDLGELAIDNLPRLLEIAARRIDQPQAAEGKRRGIAELALAHVDQLEAAAAEIADEAVGVVNAGDDADGSEFRLLGAGQNLDRHVEDALGLGDKVRTILRFAGCRRGDSFDPAHVHLVDERAETAERPERAGDCIGAEPPSGGKRTAEAAQHLFVEQRRGRTRRALINHEPDRVRSDIDHCDRA